MITRLAVRLERAGLFFLESGEDLVGDRLGDIELLQARMRQFRIWDFGLRINGGLELVDPPVDLFDTRE